MGRDRVIFRAHDVGASPAAGFAGIEVGGIGVGREDHVAGSVGDAIVGVGGTVVQELVDFVIGAAFGRRLFGADVTESMEEFVVYDTGVVEEGADNALDALDVCGG